MSDTMTIVLGGHGGIEEYQRALAAIPSLTGEEAERMAERFRRLMAGAERRANWRAFAEAVAKLDPEMRALTKRAKVEREQRRAKARVVWLAGLRHG